MRIAVVNDSKMAAESLRRVILTSRKHQLAWVAEDGYEAVQRCALDRPDLVLMDLIMPTMDGVEATRQIMAKSPCAIVVVTASVNGNAGKVFEAMGAGALDAINTPVLGLDDSGAGHAMLLHKIDTVGKLIAAPKQFAPAQAPAAPNRAAQLDGLPSLIAIGASTGGPAALQSILGALPADYPGAIVIIQHVDPQFATSFADWMDDQTPLPVALAEPGAQPTAGQVLIAGRDAHLILTRSGRLDYTPDPADYPYRPSVNVFFESMAKHWRGPGVGVLLTGMGRDGGNGLLTLRQAGHPTIAQDAATSAIYGMPKAAVELGAATEVLALDAIAPTLLKFGKRPLKP